MKKISFHSFIMCVLLFLFFNCAQKQVEKNQWLLERFWESSTMKNESLFFIQENESESPGASLLFMPEHVLSVKSATEETTYIEGKDYISRPGSRVITLTRNTSIPFKKKEEMYPPEGAPQSIKGYRGGNSNLFFSEGHIFHDLQVAVTYTHEDKWRGYIPRYAGENLPNTVKKLNNHEPVNLVLFGNSISEGYNASAHTGAPPFMPPYGKLVVINLEDACNTKINFSNQSLAGKRTDWGIENIEKVINENPGLVIIAFGMNDASGRLSPEKYSSNIRQMINIVKESCPSSEFILVATMTGNPEWTGSSPELYPQYRDALKKLCVEGIVLADMTSVWTEMLKYKKFADITGNGVNHPNDFGHRLYAEVILGLIIK